ncbi:hypothetical protein [Leisingera sp. M658]|uniref:hypothetical protein n=1 Tax=Leisingera sp. M658 TaxID=2867015 RepID=UPI0021A31168|nr:hypothetical protein [Leisingera sp. M658]UWQ73244.1 hypothetical protein K3724_11685 [Leisingera sp. M658]
MARTTPPAAAEKGQELVFCGAEDVFGPQSIDSFRIQTRRRTQSRQIHKNSVIPEHKNFLSHSGCFFDLHATLPLKTAPYLKKTTPPYPASQVLVPARQGFGE